MNKRERNTLVIGLLVLGCIFMGIGYSLYSEKLEIKGNATIVSPVFDVRFKAITSELTEGASNVEEPVISGENIANFSVDLLKKGAEATYTITIANQGNYPAKVQNIILSTVEEPFVFEVHGLDVDEVLAAGEQRQMTVRVLWDKVSEVDTAFLSQKLSVEVDFVQTSSID